MARKAISKFSKNRPAIRISGVVRAMNLARHNLGAGIPASEVDQFRQWVDHTVAQVEQTCQANRMKPEQLPAPTYRAYQYLKTLDLKNLPLLAPTGGLPATLPERGHSRRLRISNLVSRCQTMQNELAKLAIEPRSKHGRTNAVDDQLVKLLERIHKIVDEVDRFCQLAGTSPAALPDPSRRAYQWLRFLGDAGPDAANKPGLPTRHLHQHLDALQKVNELLQAGGARPKNWPCKLSGDRQRQLVQVQFFNLPALFRVKTTPDSIQIVASEGFIHAPGEVLADLLCSALARKPKNHQAEESLRRVRRFANSKAYMDLVLAMEQKSPGGELTARGHHFDLGTIFERINAQYFQDQLSRPGLTWNRILTWRKLGHYQPASDTIMVSISLDHPDVPEYVVDFIMYHEMLHKKFGIREMNGRHYAHTPQFRAAEREFCQYTEAQEFLRQIGEKPA